MLILCSLAFLAPQATGLNPGESLVELSPVVAPLDTGLRHGRLRDAFTGKPVAGAVVETWTEENDPRTGGFFRVGEGTSGVDGRFVVQGSLGGNTAEKVRVQAAGYCTLSATLGELSNDMVLFPAPVEPTRFQVLDFLDRPIAGATVTSTRSCAHDVPAFTGQSQPTGWVELETFGLQEEMPDLRLRAPGFGAIKYLDCDQFFQQSPAILRLGHRASVSYRLANKDGSPWAGATLLVMDGDGHHTLRSDSKGRFTVPSRYGPGSMGLYALQDGEQRFLATIPTIPGLELPVRDGAEEWPEDLATGTLRIEGLPTGYGEVWACHENGWLEDVSEKDQAGFEFPAGEGFLLVGGAFSGTQSKRIPFKITAGAMHALNAEAQPEPRIRLLVPEAEYSTLRIQARHETLEGPPLDKTFPVPADQKLCFLYESDGEVRRMSIDSAVEGQTIDLRPISTIVQARAPKVTRGVSPSFPFKGSTSFYSPNPLCTLATDAPGSCTLLGPIGSPYLIGFESPSSIKVWYRGVLKGPSGTLSKPSFPRPKYSSLQISGAPGLVIQGLDATDLKHLAPGPLNLIVQYPNGTRFGLSLNLESGANRHIYLQKAN